jgi:plastocyanin
MIRRLILGLMFLLSAMACSTVAGCGGKSRESANELPPYDPATATGRIFGSVTFEGTPPVMEPVRPSGSRYCVVNARNLTEQDVLVTKEGKLQNVILYVREGWQGRSYSTPDDTAVIDQQKCVYVPHVLAVQAGQKLSILNSDDTFHNIHSQPKQNPAFNIAQQSKGVVNTVSFDHSEGPFRIGCDLHSWMHVWVGVFEHPFHATSGDFGNYEIKLPPGKYEIAAWHEKLGEKTKSVEVTGNGSVQLDFSF